MDFSPFNRLVKRRWNDLLCVEQTTHWPPRQ